MNHKPKDLGVLMEEVNCRRKRSVKLKGTGLWLPEGVVEMHSPEVLSSDRLTVDTPEGIW